MTRLRFLPHRPENQEVELLVLALLGLTGNAEVFRRGKACGRGKCDLVSG